MHRSFRFLPLLLILFATTHVATARQTEVVDEIASVVGEQILLRSEVDAVVAGVVRQQGIPMTPDLWNTALQQMIDEKVLLLHARRDTLLSVSDEEVDSGLDQRIQQMASQVGGQRRLEELYGKTVVEIKAEFRDDFHDQLLADALRRKKMRTIRITPSEVQSWFRRFPTDSLPTLPEMVQIAHVVKYPTVTDEARTEANEILGAISDSIAAGAQTFEEMAQAFSEDPGSAPNGGRYESMALGELVPEFAAVASRMAIGQLSQIFESRFGLHILRVNARRGDVLDYNHILIQFDESKFDPTEAIDELAILRDSILVSGVSFSAIARRHSDEESSALLGGRIVDPSTGDRNLYTEGLGPQWQQTLSGMEDGAIGEPQETQLQDGRRAWHIVMLQRRTPSHQVGFESDYSLVEQYAQRDKENLVMTQWLQSLRTGVYIDIRTDRVQSAVNPQ